MSKDFRTYLLLSIFIHLVVFFFMWYSPAFELRQPKTYTVTWLKLSKGDFGINLKAKNKKSKTLPISTIREQKHAKKDQAKDKRGRDLRSKKSQTKKTLMQKHSQKRTSDKGGVNLKKRKSTGNRTIDSALARIDNQLKQREIKLASAQIKDGETGQSPHGGRKGSRFDPALIQYYNALKRKINRNWTTSKGQFEGQLVAKISVKIDIRGNILRSSFSKTSGDGSFDSSAMRAVRGAAPFPTPPASIRKEALTEGFLIEFNPQRAR